MRDSEYPDHRGPKSRGEVFAACLVMTFLVVTVINTLAIATLIAFDL